MNNISIRYDQSRYSDEQNERVAEAFEFASEAHAPQKRSSGEPYIVHPIAVAETVAQWGLDHEAVMAALLHDVVEDTPISLEELRKHFGDKVAELVDGVTKLSLSSMPGLDPDSARSEISTENLRKLLIATAKDFRVIMIKLADRLHNLRTLEHLDPARRTRIARESLAIFAPLADRLGMGQLKAEMEDLGFKYSRPEEYAKVAKQVKVAVKKSEQYLTLLKHDIGGFLKQSEIEVISVEGRQKHLYSVQKKLVKVDGDIDKIYDLIAIRIIVPDVPSCYHALGVIHQQYKPLIYRIKDYIAVPKPNGYQSLHTTVFARDGHITEIQIRTPEMHNEAEMGLAAHFYYNTHKTSAAYAKGGTAAKLPAKLKWVNDLANLQKNAAGRQEFMEGAHFELFSDRIFVFSPRGDLYELPEGSTPVDFAFAVHSGVGLRAMGAKVNGRITNLDSKLENRDVVEILTRRENNPNRDWLHFVKTTAAKNRIRSWFRAASHDANAASGKVALEAELKVWGKTRLEEIPKPQVTEALDALHMKSAEDLVAAIGEGSVSVTQAIRRLIPGAAKPASVPVVKQKQPTGQVITGGEQMPYTLAPCCSPVFPQPLLGYVTRGSGVTVHAVGCRNLPSDAERYIDCRWETSGETPDRLVCRVEMLVLNRLGLLADITGAVTARNLNIGGITSGESDQPSVALVSFTVEVPDLFVLSELMRQLERIQGVTSVKRV